MAVVGLVAVTAAVYALIGLLRHWHFDSSYDLAIFGQAVWHYSRLEAPESTILGASTILGDHFSPIMAVFAPLYRVAPSAGTLIVAQAVLLAASIVPVFLFLHDRVPWRIAYAFSVAYGLFWGMQRTAEFDVHEFALAPLVIATLLLAMSRRRWWLFWLMAALLVTVKEDLLPLLTALGVLLWFGGERPRGVTLAITSLLAFGVIAGIVIPAFSDVGQYAFASAYTGSANQPWDALTSMFTPVTKLRTLVSWLAPFAFLPLLSPFGALLGPLVAERFLSSSANHWGTVFHYTAPMSPILVMSAADGVARLTRRLTRPEMRSRLLSTLAITSIVVSAVVPGRLPAWKLLVPRTYATRPSTEVGQRALNSIPSDAPTVAQAAIAPHLVNRKALYLLDERARDATFVIASSRLNPWPLTDVSEIQRLIDEYRRRGYVRVFDQEGWTVLAHSDNAR